MSRVVWLTGFRQGRVTNALKPQKIGGRGGGGGGGGKETFSQTNGLIKELNKRCDSA